MKIKSGKEEIVYLLKMVFLKYEHTTGNSIRQNTNRKNYEDLAKLLSEISNRLPDTAENLQHEEYAPDTNRDKLSYPYLKYDISGGQIKDAVNGMVSNPRAHLVDACYIYLFGIGRKGFEKNPLDENLINTEEVIDRGQPYEKASRTGLKVAFIVSAILLLCAGYLAFKFYLKNDTLNTLKKDMKIGVYKPSNEEIRQLEGIWLVYIGSPQARKSEKNRYHLVVTNIVDIKYKNGYFQFMRYGASFNHTGFMQYENKDIISIHSYVVNDKDTIESPRLSLLRLEPGRKYQNVISASWNFDTARNNDVIGIREVYTKLSDKGAVKEILNTIENSSCKCKIVSVNDEHKKEKHYFLKNTSLDSLPDLALIPLLDEHSILLRNPDSTVILFEKNK